MVGAKRPDAAHVADGDGFPVTDASGGSFGDGLGRVENPDSPVLTPVLSTITR
jgi:hypothetical protein